MKQKLNEFLASLFVLVLALSCEIGSFMYGWGLKPQRWSVIIGIGLFANITLKIIATEISKKDKD